MKTVYPEYFNQFRCIASDCPDTCCAGWEIVVDEKSIQKYKALNSETGSKIRSRLTTDSDGDIIFKNETGRCPFLMQNKLCEIYANAGKDYLCRTCEMFPRFEECFGSVRETGLGLACPEAAGIILDDKGSFNLVDEYDDEPPELNEIDAQLYFELLKKRKAIFSLLEDNSMSVKKRLEITVEKHCESTQNSDISNPFELLGGFEILTEDWRKILDDSENLSSTEYGEEYKNIAEYFIYRYLLSSVFDGDYSTRIKFCVFSCAVINRMASALGVKRAAQLYSKEIEYNALNIEKVFSRLKTASRENIINFL